METQHISLFLLNVGFAYSVNTLQNIQHSVTVYQLCVYQKRKDLMPFWFGIQPLTTRLVNRLDKIRLEDNKFKLSLFRIYHSEN